MLYSDLTLPDDIREFLVDDINHLPIEPFKVIVENDPGFAPGFRPDPKNLATFRKKLVDRLLHPTRPMEPGEIWAIRSCSFNMKVIGVFSTRILLKGFYPMAEFFGGARLVAGMLVDRRKEVVDAARKIVKEGAALPPAPSDPEAARAAFRQAFKPFFDTVSAALLEPAAAKPTPRPAPSDDGLKREIEKQTKKAERAKLELNKAKDANAALKMELAAARKEAADAKAEKASAEAAVRGAAESAREAKRALERTEPRVAAAEAAKAEAEKRAREAGKRATKAEEDLRAALARAEAAEARVAALEAEKAKAPADKDELGRMLAEALPVRIDEFGPAEILSRTYGREYRRDDPVMFLIDGHNILNLNYPELSKERMNNLPHNEVRYQFVGKMKQLALGFPNSLTRVFFDGNDARQKVVSRNLMIEYSGNPNRVEEHRADLAILNHVAFLAYRNDVDLADVFVVSSDQELCSNARAFGVHTIGHSLFADLLAACR